MIGNFLFIIEKRIKLKQIIQCILGKQFKAGVSSIYTVFNINVVILLTLKFGLKTVVGKNIYIIPQIVIPKHVDIKYFLKVFSSYLYI